MHGPPPPWNNGQDITWPELPIIRVWDEVYGTFTTERKRNKWAALVQHAIEQWSSGTGLLLVHQTPVPPLSKQTDQTDQGFIDSIYSGHLTLKRLAKKYGGVLYGAGAWWPESDPGSIASYYVGVSFWQALSKYQQEFVVTHEIGHALGLRHQAGSVMDGTVFGASIYPNQHDRESLANYYA